MTMSGIRTIYRSEISQLLTEQLADCWSVVNSFFQNNTKFDFLGGHLDEVIIVGQPKGLFGLNLEFWYIVFFFIDLCTWKCPLSESAGWTLVTLERFEKFKMASKMAAVSCFHSTSLNNKDKITILVSRHMFSGSRNPFKLFIR